ncbi:MAG: DUF3617 domain-containing protein [Pacificimonas sp.]|jgi:hypothetical protein|nr:DUF3617 domain-containing protein [Pacificimonas sp.]
MNRKLFLGAALAALPEAAFATPNPGLWEVKGKTTDVAFSSDAIPAAMLDMIKNQIMSQPGQDHQQCVTAEDIENAPEMLVKSSESACEYERFDMSGGTLDAVAVCNFPQGGTGRMDMTGRYTDTTYTTRSKITMADGPMGSMTIHAESTGTRIGDC